MQRAAKHLAWGSKLNRQQWSERSGLLHHARCFAARCMTATPNTRPPTPTIPAPPILPARLSFTHS